MGGGRGGRSRLDGGGRAGQLDDGYVGGDASMGRSRGSIVHLDICEGDTGRTRNRRLGILERDGRETGKVVDYDLVDGGEDSEFRSGGPHLWFLQLGQLCTSQSN